NRNNCRLFHDVTSDRMVFIPHGVDQIFQKTQGRILPPARGLVGKALLEIPEERRRYLERVAFVATNVFNADAMMEQARELSGKIESAISKTDLNAALRGEVWFDLQSLKLTRQ